MTLARLTSTYRSKLIANSYKNWLRPKYDALDIGCGTGIVTVSLNNTFKFKKIVGTDIDNYLSAGIKFVKMPTENILPFKKNDFNVAMLNDVLHHTTYDNQLRIIQEALRVANQVLIFELKPTLVGKIGDYILNKIHHPAMNIPFTYRTAKEWQKLFRENGINYTTKKVKSPFWYPFTHVAFKLTFK